VNSQQQPPKSNVFKAGCGVFAVLVLLAYCGRSKPVATGAASTPAQEPAARSPTPEPRQAPVKAAPAPAEAVELKAILGEYADNEVRADARYKGKLVKVTGIVGDVKKDILGGIYVTLGTGKAFEIPVVQCMVDDDYAARVSALSKGAKVTVQGRVTGLMMNVLVDDCAPVD